MRGRERESEREIERENDCSYGVIDGQTFSISVLSKTKIATMFKHVEKKYEICFSQNLFARQDFCRCLSREFSRERASAF